MCSCLMRNGDDTIPRVTEMKSTRFKYLYDTTRSEAVQSTVPGIHQSNNSGNNPRSFMGNMQWCSDKMITNLRSTESVTS